MTRSAHAAAPPIAAQTWQQAMAVATDPALDRIRESDSYVTAVHEAGHVWCYWTSHLSIFQVTVVPQPPAYRGRVDVPMRRVGWSIAACTAAAGPVAQAVHSMLTTDPAEGIDWVDHMRCATLAGGEEDIEAAAGALDESASPYLAFLRDQLLRDWAAITALAVKLLRDGTVQGHLAFEILAANGAQRWTTGTRRAQPGRVPAQSLLR